MILSEMSIPCGVGGQKCGGLVLSLKQKQNKITKNQCIIHISNALFVLRLSDLMPHSVFHHFKELSVFEVFDQYFKLGEHLHVSHLIQWLKRVGNMDILISV